MSTNFYLPRRLLTDVKTFTEEELLHESKYVVVLSEPGGGKTSLLESLAPKLGVLPVSANVFSFGSNHLINPALVIDAFDELAKIDQAGIQKLLSKASQLNPSAFIISSRSSEWDLAANHTFADFLGHEPLVVRLCEFEENEQEAIFHNYASGEDFAVFKSEVSKFDLDALLPNPQFLKLFADAYIESGRRFSDKRSIFSLAVERLAKEANPKVSTKNNIVSLSDKVKIGSEIFAKILLSGLEGVTTSETSDSRIYSPISSLTNKDKSAATVLATRLFKPGSFSGLHRPVHKVVSEYCAASYLITRIEDPQDPLTLSKCLPVIAPNRTVRDELRGLLGWMAALGNKSIEEAAIKLDPYAVLANGDPSQLEPRSKRLLIRELKDIESKDPYFRRGDFWRRFSVAGFFDHDVVEELRPILESDNDGNLRDLVLELLVGSSVVAKLRDELQKIVISTGESENSRMLAFRVLTASGEYDHHADFMALVLEGCKPSLRVASMVFELMPSRVLDKLTILKFFQACSSLYPRGYDRSERIIGDRYFVKRSVSSLDLCDLEWLLDELCKDLVCVCGRQYYECECRSGTSKVIGSMLDRFFKLALPPYDHRRIWTWVENLNFYYPKNSSQSKSVEVMQNDTQMRQGIMSHAFGFLRDNKTIFETRVEKFDYHSHSGLTLNGRDTKFLVDLAYHSDNYGLWSSFVVHHQRHSNGSNQFANEFRRHLRSHAAAKPEFMRAWVKANRSAANVQQLPGMKALLRRVNRNKRNERMLNEQNIRYVLDNREFVEAGNNWSCLVRFADLILMHPDKVQDEFGDVTIVLNGLINCLSFIKPHVPSLLDISRLRCESRIRTAERILYAACVVIMRTKHRLSDVEDNLLISLRVSLSTKYSGVGEDEREAIKQEVDQRIFVRPEIAEDFLRQYIEPQLEFAGRQISDIRLLSNDNAFSHLRPKLSTEWLGRFDNLKYDELDLLFNMAAQFSDFGTLLTIINHRCQELIGGSVDECKSEDILVIRTFWFLRALYFIEDVSEWQLVWLNSDKDLIFAFAERSDRFGYQQNSAWPSLSAKKIQLILTVFINYWPVVDLPNDGAMESSNEENAYRFLKNLIWSLSSLDPDDALPVLENLLLDVRFDSMHKDLSSIQSAQLRSKALRDFVPPSAEEIMCLLDRGAVVTVEGLRQQVIEELDALQKDVDGGEFDTIKLFYERGERLDEVGATLIIADRLDMRFAPQGISLIREHHLRDDKRCDFTVTKFIGGKKRLLVAEVKGQWNKALYTAAKTQLSDLYAINPSAEQQGVYLVLWYGVEERVAGLKRHGIKDATQLKSKIESLMPRQLLKFIDVFVLDLSK